MSKEMEQALMVEKASEVDDDIVRTKRDRAVSKAIELIDKQVQMLAYYNGPRVVDKWEVMHLITDAWLLAEPGGAADRLESWLEFRTGPSRDSVTRQHEEGKLTKTELEVCLDARWENRYIGPVISALRELAWNTRKANT